MGNYKEDFIAVTVTKYYFHAVAAVRRLFPTITAKNCIWLFTAAGKQILIIFLLYLLKRKKKENYCCYIDSEKDFATDDIRKINKKASLR